MRVLLDHNLPRQLRRHLAGHEVKTTREMAWSDLENGLLLASAADAGFEVFLSIDKKIEYEQNLTSLPIAVVILDAYTNALPGLLPFVPSLSNLLASQIEHVLYVVEPDGTVLRLRRPR